MGWKEHHDIQQGAKPFIWRYKRLCTSRCWGHSIGKWDLEEEKDLGVTVEPGMYPCNKRASGIPGWIRGSYDRKSEEVILLLYYSSVETCNTASYSRGPTKRDRDILERVLWKATKNIREVKHPFCVWKGWEIWDCSAWEEKALT